MSSNKTAFLLGAACIAGGVAIGSLLTRGVPPIMVNATATQSHDNFVVATGMVGKGLEAVFFLDFLTGDLKATVVDERRGGFNAFYEYNIAADFNLGTVKNPKYLMVTGLALDARGRGAGSQLGQSIVYIVEATSGQVAAYGLPWSPSHAASGKPQRGTFIPLAKSSLRNTFVRDQ